MELKTISFLRALPGSSSLGPVANRPVSVYVADGNFTTLADGVLNSAGGAENPLTTDDNGQVQISAPDGEYDLRCVNADGTFIDKREAWLDTAEQAAEVEANRIQTGLDREQTGIERAVAEAAADDAQSFAGAAQIFANVYETIALGLAAVADNAYFKVRRQGADGLNWTTLFKRLTASTYELVDAYVSGMQFSFVQSRPGREVISWDPVTKRVVLANSFGKLRFNGFESTSLDLLIGQIEALRQFVISRTESRTRNFVLTDPTTGRVLLSADSIRGIDAISSYGRWTSRPVPPLSTSGAKAYRWKAAVGKFKSGGGGVPTIMAVGDSYEDRPLIPQVVKDRCVAALGESGSGWISSAAGGAGIPAPLAGVTVSGVSGWTVEDISTAPFSPDGYAASATGTAATITYSGLMGQTITFSYYDGDGTLRYTLNGAAPVSLAGLGTNARKKVTINTGGPGPHTLVVDTVGNTGTARRLGFHCRSTTVGVEYNKIGNGGSRASDFAAIATALGVYAGEINPDVITIQLGTNELNLGSTPTEFYTALGTILDALHSAVATAAIWLRVPPQPNTYSTLWPLTAYRDVMFRLAQERDYVEFFNGADLFAPDPARTPTLWLDTLHLAPEGAYVLGPEIQSRCLPIL